LSPVCHPVEQQWQRPGTYLDTFTYDYRGRVEEQSRVINGRTYTMTVNQFDQLDRPVWTAYDFVVTEAKSWVVKRPYAFCI